MGQGLETSPFPVRPRSGQVTVGASGTVSGLPSIPCDRALFLARPTNAGVVWIGNATGTLSGNTGFPLSAAGPGVPMEGLNNLDQILVVGDVQGDQLCWMILDSDPTD